MVLKEVLVMRRERGVGGASLRKRGGRLDPTVSPLLALWSLGSSIEEWRRWSGSVVKQEGAGVDSGSLI